MNISSPSINLDRAALQQAKNSFLSPSSVPWPAVGVFVALAMGLAWLVQLPLWISGQGLQNPLFGLTTAGMQFTPTIAALIVAFFIKRPPNIPRLLGLSPLRPVKRTLGLSLIVLFGIPVLVFLAMLLGQAMGLIRLDLTSFSGLTERMAAAGQTIPDGSNIGLVVILQLAFLPIIAIVSSATALGEELGWRGWLLPNLLPLGTWPALILTGIIWGLWHSPIILLGYNYGRTDFIGVALMTGWCVLLGIVLGWLRLRSASIWPAAIGHGTINASAITLLIFATAGQGQEAAYGTILGWSGWIVLALVILVLMISGQLRKQPQPGVTFVESATKAVPKAENGQPATRDKRVLRISGYLTRRYRHGKSTLSEKQTKLSRGNNAEYKNTSAIEAQLCSILNDSASIKRQCLCESFKCDTKSLLG